MKIPGVKMSFVPCVLNMLCTWESRHSLLPLAVPVHNIMTIGALSVFFFSVKAIFRNPHGGLELTNVPESLRGFGL